MNYKVESFGYWFIVNAPNKKKAYSEGVKEYGRGRVQKVSVAKDNDMRIYIRDKGVKAIEILN